MADWRPINDKQVPWGTYLRAPQDSILISYIPHLDYILLTKWLFFSSLYKLNSSFQTLQYAVPSPWNVLSSRPALSHFCDLNLCANSSWRHSHPPSKRATPPTNIVSPRSSFPSKHIRVVIFVCWFMSVASLLNKMSSVKRSQCPSFSELCIQHPA